jgi:sirohydrochlorin cobaltochelatase
MVESGPARVGQVVLWGSGDEGYSLCHERDVAAAEPSLQAITRVEDAREVAKYAPDGGYRVLKTGRDLRSGWILRLPSADELVRAVDLIYPAVLGQSHALECGKIRVIPLRETLQRQTGMYRRARGISDSGISRIVEGRCRALCLRRVLWPEGRLPGGLPTCPTHHIPLVCSEACQLLVADACRAVTDEVNETAQDT